MDSNDRGILTLLAKAVRDLREQFTALSREGTATSRLKRHNKTSTGWRKAVAVWAEQHLDQFDPSGDHI